MAKAHNFIGQVWFGDDCAFTINDASSAKTNRGDENESVMIGAANRAIIIQIYLAEHDFRLIMKVRTKQTPSPNYSSIRASTSNPSHQRNTMANADIVSAPTEWLSYIIIQISSSNSTNSRRQILLLGSERRQSCNQEEKPAI